ncbi:helix-turn-helix domain-containing protein [Hydrogenimonas urashimensis]|uniref:helix-turn-helix domain-containing protein n=1 Tax=Hydrogenimonas urashimensis TaxID=2740515 RepID=UPI0019158AA5|nr:helix-turn-helix transcriptional regulator [Hydrogenimonas urashimensis]
MQHGHYIRECRERLGLTQEGLAEALYLFDDDRFQGVDMTTISKWERGVTHPPVARMSALIRFFQAKSGKPLPCWGAMKERDVETLTYSGEVSRMLGHPRRMVQNTPLSVDFAKGFSLLSLRGHPRAGEILELTAMMIDETNSPYTRVSAERLKRWMAYPDHLFVAAAYKDTFLGFFFMLRLKPESFDALMRFKKRKNELKEEDFAMAGEPACIYLLAFFSLTQQIGTLLSARLYAHLIAHQSEIEEVGFVSSMPETVRIAQNMPLEHTDTYTDGDTAINAYRNDLFAMLSSETMIRILFSKHRNR